MVNVLAKKRPKHKEIINNYAGNNSARDNSVSNLEVEQK
jgi:hypothetical protein